MSQPSYQAQILKALAETVFKLQSPEKTNVGRRLSDAYLWDTIQSFAKKQSDKLWADLEKDGIYNLEDAGDVEGEFILAKSPRFTLNLKVTAKVKRFSPQALAVYFKKTYKVPEPITIKACEDAKVPTKGNKQLSIIEVA